MTVADKIRSLDDDGLAEWLTELWFDAIAEGFRANGIPAVKPNKSETRGHKEIMLKLLGKEVQEMDDYIRRSDAIKAMREWGNREENIRLVPAADVVSVVRCKDCKHRILHKHYAECDLDTGDPYALGRNAEEDDWFCADGEKK